VSYYIRLYLTKLQPFHLAKNHPFIDGKRTAFATMVALLSINSYSLNLSQDQAYTLVMRVAQGGMTKEEISRFLEKHVQPK